MSQVSLPSQIGATENIMRSRQFSLCAALNRMPMPRSKPSTTTYMVGGLRPGRFVSWADFQTFVREREWTLRLFGRALGAGDVIDRVGPFAQDLGQVVAAEPEHDHV